MLFIYKRINVKIGKDSGSMEYLQKPLSFGKTYIGNQQVPGFGLTAQKPVYANTDYSQQKSNNTLQDNVANRVLPNNINNIPDNSRLKDYSQMYAELSGFVGKDGKKHLKILHQNKKLVSSNSNDKSLTIENLYKIMNQPRAGGFDSKIILEETLKILADPYQITQDFGRFNKVPEPIISGLIKEENARVQNRQKEEMFKPKTLRSEYERKEILKEHVPLEFLKPKAVEIAKKLNTHITNDTSLDDILDANEEKLLQMQKKAGKDKQKLEQVMKLAVENENLRAMVETIDFNKGHTCPAASIEFDLADKKPAEFARYVERLTSPDKCVKTRIKYSNIAEDMPAAISKLVDWKVDYKSLNSSEIEVMLRPDENAYPRAIIQEYAGAKNSRSTVDALLQSTFMQMGSGKTYNSLTDLRSEDTGGGRGLNQEEGAFIESIVDFEGGKDSITYMELDDNLTKVNKYYFDPKITEAQLTETLSKGKNIMVGFLTDVDPNGNLVTPNGHEVLLTGITVDKSGEKYFQYQDSDDGNHYAPSYIKASELIRTLHHANLPKHVVKKYISPQQDSRLMLIADYWELKKENEAQALQPQQQARA